MRSRITCAASRIPNCSGHLFPTLWAIIHAHVEGTRFGIHVDANDGLLHAGQAGIQLTWMDAKHGEEVFTPRIGKPVEINALWLNALNVMVRARRAVHRFEREALLRIALGARQRNFARFWNEERDCLYDVIDVDGPRHSDDKIDRTKSSRSRCPTVRCRPAQMRAVVEPARGIFLTSYGLRSLERGRSRIPRHYAGDPWHRDAAYHMGTVWPWLLGPFARAHFRVYGDARLAQSFLEPIAQHVNAACIGTVSEIFDGDAPHSASGCFAQAWSVAEILRSWMFSSARSRRLKEIFE